MKVSVYKLLLIAPLVITNFCNSPDFIDLGNFELYYALFLIFVLGIPHGAMDHIIFKKEKKEISHLFTLLYWALGIGNAVLWFFFPLEVTLFFIVVSAFHFGEAQFSSNDYLNKKRIFLVCWGMTVITLLLGKNVGQLETYVATYDNPVFYQNILFYLKNNFIFYSFLLFTVLYKLYFLVFQRISLKLFLRESLLFSIVLIFMSFANTLVGITTFFVLIHSMNVLEQEFKYLKAENPSFSILDFIKVIFPFSILSYILVGTFFILSMYGVVEISNAYLILVILSSLTLPHAVVMHIFYNNAKE